MDKIKTTSFDLILQDNKQLECHFIKHDISTPLLMSCYFGYNLDNYIIGVIEGFNQSNLHHKYNFVFETQDINETIYTIESEFAQHFIKNVYPEILDFNKKDSYEIFINPGLNNISLIENGKDLECKDGKDLKICTVPKSYFKDKNKVYYYLQHKGKVGDSTINFINYETFGVKLENPSNSGEISKYSLVLFALIFLFVL